LKKVYLINLSFGIAGIEKRFLNIWKTLKLRNNVIPILVIPDTLANLLCNAGKLDLNDNLLIVVPEISLIRKLTSFTSKYSIINSIKSIIRSRFMSYRYKSVWRKIEKDKNDVVIHMGMKCSGLFPPDCPIVYECVDSLLNSFNSGHFIRASKKKSIINCQTDRIKNALTSSFKNEKTLWQLFTSPIYFADYSYSLNKSNSKDEKLILFAGRLSKVKNPELFVDAINELYLIGYKLHALILGEGPLFSIITEQIKNLKLNNCLEIRFSNNPVEYMNKAAIFVSLQEGDNYGSQSLLEAMASGCSIIASNVGETSRIIDESVGTLTTFDLNELVLCIKKMLDNPAETNEKGKNAEVLATKVYTADKYCEYLENLYSLAYEKHNNLNSFNN
jgi:glycosyltransferase involved in cell wall biosynthesis